MPAIVHWCDWSGEGLERCHLSETAEGFTLEGVLIGTREGHYGAHYLVHTDAHFHTRQVRVAYLGGPCLEVEADGQGRWWDRLSGEPLSSLDGCLDVDIGTGLRMNARAHVLDGSSAVLCWFGDRGAKSAINSSSIALARNKGQLRRGI